MTTPTKCPVCFVTLPAEGHEVTTRDIAWTAITTITCPKLAPDEVRMTAPVSAIAPSAMTAIAVNGART